MANKKIKQLIERGTGIEIVPVTHWDVVTDKPELQGKLTAGTGIKIDSANTISCTFTGTTPYDDTWVRTAISGITTALTENTTAISAETENRISADTELQNNIDLKQDELTPGKTITISGSTISTNIKIISLL